ncbi:MAG: hypothetical protein AB7O57_23590 [Hyphomicrobiaceae bacterium]
MRFRPMRIAVPLLCLIVALLLPSPAQSQPRPPSSGGGQYLWVGLAVDPENNKGAYVIGVTPGSPAEKAKVPTEVYITEVNGTDITKTGMQGWQAAQQGKRPGDTLTVSWLDDHDRKKSADIKIEIMTGDAEKMANFFVRDFSPKFANWKRATDANDTAAMVTTRDDCAKLCEPMRRDLVNGFKKPDEFYLEYVRAMGFLGRTERKALEKEFDKLKNPKVRRGQTPPVRLYTKMYMCWALTAMQDADTDPDMVKAMVEGGETPEMSMAGCQLIVAMFLDLAQDEAKNIRKIEKLSADLVKLDIIATLGNPVIDDNLKMYCGNLDKVKGIDPRALSPQDQQAIAASNFWVGRARWHARALGWLRDRLSISFLTRAKDQSATQMAPAAMEGLKRLIPDSADSASYDWYKDNAQYIDYDDDAHVFRFYADAKAAGQPASEWRKANEK